MLWPWSASSWTTLYISKCVLYIHLLYDMYWVWLFVRDDAAWHRSIGRRFLHVYCRKHVAISSLLREKKLNRGFMRAGGSVVWRENDHLSFLFLTIIMWFPTVDHCVCFRIYERVLEAPYMDIPEDTSFWLGQRNAAHGFFKVNTTLPSSHSEYIKVDVCPYLSYY